MCTNAAGLAWVINLGCIDLNPWSVRKSDVDRPDELRVDLDPQPDAAWDDVRRVALVVRDVLGECGLVGFPRTSGSRGIQNARDPTVASAYSVRPRPDARVSTPIAWDEVPEVDPANFTLDTVPERVARMGGPAADIDARPCRLDGLLAFADRDTANGLPDAPWPPHYPKAPDEPIRAQPGRRRRPAV